MPCSDLIRSLVPELVPLLTHYTQNALGALVHLADAWQMADNVNARMLRRSIGPLVLSLSSDTSRPLAWYVLVNRLGTYGVNNLVNELEGDGLALVGTFREHYRSAVEDAPTFTGVWICCGRAVLRGDGTPGRHLGDDRCAELGQVQR